MLESVLLLGADGVEHADVARNNPSARMRPTRPCGPGYRADSEHVRGPVVLLGSVPLRCGTPDHKAARLRVKGGGGLCVGFRCPRAFQRHVRRNKFDAEMVVAAGGISTQRVDEECLLVTRNGHDNSTAMNELDRHAHGVTAVEMRRFRTSRLARTEPGEMLDAISRGGVTRERLTEGLLPDAVTGPEFGQRHQMSSFGHRWADDAEGWMTNSTSHKGDIQ